MSVSQIHNKTLLVQVLVVAILTMFVAISIALDKIISKNPLEIISCFIGHLQDLLIMMCVDILKYNTLQLML